MSPDFPISYTPWGGIRRRGRCELCFMPGVEHQSTKTFCYADLLWPRTLSNILN
jgi:hypothetical protein